MDIVQIKFVSAHVNRYIKIDLTIFIEYASIYNINPLNI